MEKNKLKKQLYYLCLIPYIYVGIMCIYYAIVGNGMSLGETAYGIVAIGNYLSDFFANLLNDILDFNYKFFILLLWICYQIYYFISSKNEETKESIQIKDDIKIIENDNKVRKIDLKKIFFIISTICWGIYFISGICAFFIGYDIGLFYSNRVYGIEALKSALFLNLLAFSIIPILPISLIYIIIYLIVKKKKN